MTRHSSAGSEIFCERDPFGLVRVVQDGHVCTLVFGADSEQGCVDLQSPGRPPYGYVQAMLLGLLLVPAPRRVTLLGLGAAALANAILASAAHLPALRARASFDDDAHAYAPDAGMSMVVVELRQAVVDAARRCMAFDAQDNVEVVVGDALDYIPRAAQSADVLFVDLYTEEGIDTAQLDEQFVEECARALRPGGVLVINLWDEDWEMMRRRDDALYRVFPGRLMACRVNSGNVVLFAASDGLVFPRARRLLADARRLGKVLGVPLSHYAGVLTAVPSRE